MNEALADCVIERHRKRLHGRARRITIDLDPTGDPTHGHQQFTFFNGVTPRPSSSLREFQAHETTPEVWPSLASDS